MDKEKPKVLSIRLGAQATLDLVWQGDNAGGGICLVVFAERGAVHRRTIAKLHPDQAMEAARFLARVEALPATGEEEETKP